MTSLNSRAISESCNGSGIPFLGVRSSTGSPVVGLAKEIVECRRPSQEPVKDYGSAREETRGPRHLARERGRFHIAMV